MLPILWSLWSLACYPWYQFRSYSAIVWLSPNVTNSVVTLVTRLLPVVSIPFSLGHRSVVTNSVITLITRSLSVLGVFTPLDCHLSVCHQFLGHSDNSRYQAQNPAHIRVLILTVISRQLALLFQHSFAMISRLGKLALLQNAEAPD